MKYYYIINDSISTNPNWDTFSGIFTAEAEAITAAENEWRWLTSREKADRRVTVYYGEVAAGVEVDDAYDYICENETGGYLVKVFDCDHCDLPRVEAYSSFTAVRWNGHEIEIGNSGDALAFYSRENYDTEDEAIADWTADVRAKLVDEFPGLAEYHDVDDVASAAARFGSASIHDAW